MHWRVNVIPKRFIIKRSITELTPCQINFPFLYPWNIRKSVVFRGYRNRSTYFSYYKFSYTRHLLKFVFSTVKYWSKKKEKRPSRRSILIWIFISNSLLTIKKNFQKLAMWSICERSTCWPCFLNLSMIYFDLNASKFRSFLLI